MLVTTGMVRASKHRYESLSEGGRGGGHRITNVSPLTRSSYSEHTTETMPGLRSTET